MFICLIYKDKDIIFYVLEIFFSIVSTTKFEISSIFLHGKLFPTRFKDKNCQVHIYMYKYIYIYIFTEKKDPKNFKFKVDKMEKSYQSI